MGESAQEKMRKLQLIEENLHGYLAQKQQVQSQLLELESALAALEGASSSYRIIGNLMVAASPEELRKDVEERIERSKVRLAAVEKQELRLKERAEGVQQEVLSLMKKEG